MSDAPIFIVGMPRSGTTLLLAMLSAHSQIAITPETQFFGIWMRLYKHLDIRKDNDFKLFWHSFTTGRHFTRLGLSPAGISKRIEESHEQSFRTLFAGVLQEYASSKGKPRWGEKSPRHFAHIQTITEWYPNAKVLYLIRDPRAAVASAVRAPWGNPSVARQAQVWNKSIACYEEVQNDPRIRLVRYEELVSNPENVLRDICTFLGEEFEDQMLSHAEHTSLKDYEPSHGIWGKRHKQMYMDTVRTDKIESWKERLSEKQIAVTEHITANSMRRYGYHAPSSTLSASQCLYLQCSLLLAIPGIYKPISQLWLAHHAYHVPLSWIVSRIRRLV